jgi:hypothetical protein
MKGLKPIKGYNDQYFAHPDGYIYSSEQITSDGRRIRGRVLKATKRPDGYHTVTLYSKGKKVQYLLHRLLCSTLLDGYDEDLQVNHKDLNKSNNRLDNLEMVTPLENSRHASANGHFPKTNCLPKEVVEEIRTRLKRGEQQKDIALIVGVSRSAVCRINKGVTYA